MNVVIATLAAMSAAVHVYIFWLEAVAFDSATTRAAFRIRTPEQADAIRPWAYNQGFYNLFLALAVLAGVALLLAGASTVGVTAICFATEFRGLTYDGDILDEIRGAVMLAAAALLATSDRRMLKSAIVQGLAPALTIVAIASTR